MNCKPLIANRPKSYDAATRLERCGSQAEIAWAKSSIGIHSRISRIRDAPALYKYELIFVVQLELQRFALRDV
jgi:hypothetical protein